MEDETLEQYFKMCLRVYEQMERDGTWPWASDSPNAEDLIESKDSSDDV
tara:strand:+ start:630 stop:776 length:147 start_codon:yes stop_codon:yes gene_type:complete